MRQFRWLLCVAKNCDWSWKITPLSNTGLVEWNLTAKVDLNCEIFNSWRKCWKNQVSFCHRSSPVSRKVSTLPWKLQELKKSRRKTCGCDLEAIWFESFEWIKRSVNDGRDFCLLRLVILKSVWYSVEDTFELRYGWPCAVVSYILSSLLCPETDRNIRIGKEGKQSDVLMSNSWHQSVCQH